MRVAVVDHIATIGAGRKFTPSILRGLIQARPDVEYLLITEKEALARDWFGGLEDIAAKRIGIVAESTLDRWLPPGRIGKIPGTWRFKTAVRQQLKRHSFDLEKQFRKHLRCVDLVYFPWPSFDHSIDWPMPVVFTLQDLLWKRTRVLSPENEQAKDTSIAHWIAHGATVATTRDLQNDILSHYKKARRVEVIYNTAPILPEPLIGAARTAHLSQRNIAPPFALCPAGLWPHKNHETLIRAWGKLKRQGTRLSLVCVGPYTAEAFGENEQSKMWERARLLRELALSEGLELGSDVIGLGYVSERELATSYSAASFVIMASLAEGGSLPLIEGAAQAVPLVCSDISVYREQMALFDLRPRYFDPSNADSISAVVQAQLRDSPTREELRAGANHVRARTWQLVAQEYWNVFDSMMQV